jgi:hypothetical protein
MMITAVQNSLAATAAGRQLKQADNRGTTTIIPKTARSGLQPITTAEPASAEVS